MYCVISLDEALNLVLINSDTPFSFLKRLKGKQMQFTENRTYTGVHYEKVHYRKSLTIVLKHSVMGHKISTKLLNLYTVFLINAVNAIILFAFCLFWILKTT